MEPRRCPRTRFVLADWNSFFVILKILQISPPACRWLDSLVVHRLFSPSFFISKCHISHRFSQSLEADFFQLSSKRVFSKSVFYGILAMLPHLVLLFDAPMCSLCVCIRHSLWEVLFQNFI